MAKIKNGMLINIVQVLKVWPPIKGIIHPIKKGNVKPIRKPNSLNVFLGYDFSLILI